MSLTLFKRGKVWYYRGTVAGRRLRGSTGAEGQTIARRIADEVAAKQWKGRLDGPEAVLTFARAAMFYREAGKPSRFLTRIEDYWGETLVKDITTGAIRSSAKALYPRASGATLNRHVLVPTQAIINHAADIDLCPPIVRMKRFPVIKHAKEPATWPWVEAFMAHASPHLGALACFMFLPGARITEAISLRWADINLSEARALIRQTKIGAERRPHLPPVLVAAMANIGSQPNPFNNQPANERVFGYLSRDNAAPRWEAAIRRAGIKPLSFHSCRHGFATSMLQAGVDVVSVAKLGGWKSPAHVFATYGHAAEDDTLADRITGGSHFSVNRKKA
jgi:integrase